MPASSNLLTLVLKPITRLLVGAIAIPLVRSLRKRVPGIKQWDAELEKDIDQWFRGSLLLLVAMKNTETWLMTWINRILEAWALGQGESVEPPEIDLNKWYITAGRLLLAIGVIESMPDQELFSLIHPGPKLKFIRGKSLCANLQEQWRPCLRGLLCQHLNRASPLFAILTVFYGGVIGWVFYLLAIVQYLIIGLVTSRDKALDVLTQFDRAVAERRREILDELTAEASPAGPPHEAGVWSPSVAVGGDPPPLPPGPLDHPEKGDQNSS